MIFSNENICINIEGKIIVHNSILCSNKFLRYILINGGDFDKCGGDIDGAILQWGDLTFIPIRHLMAYPNFDQTILCSYSLIIHD